MFSDKVLSDQHLLTVFKIKLLGKLSDFFFEGNAFANGVEEETVRDALTFTNRF
jgi:hypothetical protein